jgi:hypothetical protein
MSRRFNATRYWDENNNGQCVACNVFNHGEQYKYAIALDLKYGEGTAKKLSKMAQEYHKFTREELEEVIHDCREQIKFYTNEK